MSIHPSAVISSAANIDSSAEVGPFCIIEGDVTIGPRTIVDVRLDERRVLAIAVDPQTQSENHSPA